jgi:NAD(P)-dependent dehydrogenase (short-subunit alcohol dehydrogenase family)
MSIPRFARAVVTGAGSGLGREFCLELARRGDRVLCSDVDEEAARRTAVACGPADTHAIRCDVAKLEDVEALAARAGELFGGVDLLINNAGVAVSGRIGEISIADWRWLLGVNLWGVIHGCHVFAPILRRQRGGHILNVASLAGLVHLPPLAPYNVAKAAVVALSETLRYEVARDGVGVTVLCPSFFPTGIAGAARGDAEMNRLGERILGRSRMTAGEVARAALDGAARGDFMVIPMASGRWAWRLKRLSPGRFFDVSRIVLRAEARRFGVDPGGML